MVGGQGRRRETTNRKHTAVAVSVFAGSLQGTATSGVPPGLALGGPGQINEDASPAVLVQYLGVLTEKDHRKCQPVIRPAPVVVVCRRLLLPVVIATPGDDAGARHSQLYFHLMNQRSPPFVDP